MSQMLSLYFQLKEEVYLWENFPYHWLQCRSEHKGLYTPLILLTKLSCYPPTWRRNRETGVEIVCMQYTTIQIEISLSANSNWTLRHLLIVIWRNSSNEGVINAAIQYFFGDRYEFITLYEGNFTGYFKPPLFVSNRCFYSIASELSSRD